jgi:hypothetical protein
MSDDYTIFSTDKLQVMSKGLFIDEALPSNNRVHIKKAMKYVTEL